LSVSLEAGILDMFNPDVVPVYPPLNKMNENNMVVNGVNMKMMLLKGDGVNIPDVVEYYKKILSQKGWREQGSGNSIQLGNIIALNFVNSKGHLLSLNFVSGKEYGIVGNKVFVRIMHIFGNQEQQKVLGFMVSHKDLPGFDIPWLKRYPESIRTQSVRSDSGFMSVNYKVVENSCVDCVTDFYIPQMREQGWKLVSMKDKTKEEMVSDRLVLKTYVNKFKNRIKEELTPQLDISHYKQQMHTELNNRLDETNADDQTRKKAEEEFNKAFDKQQSYFEDFLSEETDLNKFLTRNTPDTMRTLIFQKNKNVCAIFVIYKEAKEEDMYGIDSFGGQAMAAAPEEYRNMFAAMQDEQLKERLEIGIQYMPESMLYSKEKAWF